MFLRVNSASEFSLPLLKLVLRNRYLRGEENDASQIMLHGFENISHFLSTVIKGKVLLIDEDNTVLNYVVEVQKIIKQGNKNIDIKRPIEFTKRGSCQSPDLKEREEYLFMGLDKTGKYLLDQNSFVKLWPTKPSNNKDKMILDQFEDQFAC